MKTQLIFQAPTRFATPLLAVFAVDASPAKDEPSLPVLLTTSKEVADAAAKVLSSGEFQAALGETVLIHAPTGLQAERLLIIGLGMSLDGSQSKAKPLSSEEIRKAAGTAVRAAKPRGLRSVTILFPEDHVLSGGTLDGLPAELTARVMVEGAEIAEMDWDTYKSDRKDRAVHETTILVNAATSDSSPSTRTEIERGFAEGLILAASQNFARALVNEPGNVLTPTVLGERAAAMCREFGLGCEVHSTDRLHELKMGAFWAVAQGSAEPPALIVMTYEPAAKAGDGAIAPPVLGLVGKGITFDTGGISIKPADGMEKMKYDMAGAAAMIGAMRAIAQLKPSVKVIGIVCSAENMPDGKAFKPGDVVTAMSGKTIEVVNTDAEGRLVLADGLHYAKTLGCTHLIDAATLTGACAVALGKINAGLFSNDDATCERFQQALKTSGEKFWRLPCTPDYRDEIKSQIADMMNTGATRYGGATSAAMFLAEFADDTPWVHLDIAGCAWNDEQKPWIAKGPAGIAVRSIVDWVRSYAT